MDQLHQIYRQRRISLGLTQADAASAAGVTRKTVSDFENGGGGLRLRSLKRLLQAVGLDLTTRDASSRPTLDELPDLYRADESQQVRQRARKRKAP